MTPLDRIEAAEKAATTPPWSDPSDRFDATTTRDGQLPTHAEANAWFDYLLRNHAADLIAVARAAQTFMVEFDGPGGEYAPFDDTEAALRAALALLTEDSE